jgi:hypothetical protein
MTKLYFLTGLSKEINISNQVATSNCQGSHTGQEVIIDLFFCARIFAYPAGF